MQWCSDCFSAHVISIIISRYLGILHYGKCSIKILVDTRLTNQYDIVFTFSLLILCEGFSHFLAPKLDRAKASPIQVSTFPQCAVSNAIHLKACSHSLCRQQYACYRYETGHHSSLLLHHYIWRQVATQCGVGGDGERQSALNLSLLSLVCGWPDNPDFCLQIHVQAQCELIDFIKSSSINNSLGGPLTGWRTIRLFKWFKY